MVDERDARRARARPLNGGTDVRIAESQAHRLQHRFLDRPQTDRRQRLWCRLLEDADLAGVRDIGQQTPAYRARFLYVDSHRRTGDSDGDTVTGMRHRTVQARIGGTNPGLPIGKVACCDLAEAGSRLVLFTPRQLLSYASRQPLVCPIATATLIGGALLLAQNLVRIDRKGPLQDHNGACLRSQTGTEAGFR